MLLPSGPRTPIWMQTWQWLRRPTELLERCAERYGPIFSLSIVGFGKMVVVSEPDSVRRLFAAGPEELSQPRNSRFLEALGSTSLLLLNGEEHLRHRRLLLPALRIRRSPEWRQSLGILRERAIASWPVGRPFSLLCALQDFTRRSMVQLLFGAEDAALAEILVELLKSADTMMNDPLIVLPLSVQGLLGARSPWARSMQILREGDRHIYATIASRRRATDLAQRQDTLSQLLQVGEAGGQPLTDQELRDELFTLLVAGIDTTAIVLCWTLHELLGNPELMARIEREVRATRRGDSLDLDGLEQAPLLDATLRESLRLWPVFPILARELRQPMELSGYELKAGTRVVLCPYLAHRCARSFPDPRRFIPERFLSSQPRAFGSIYFPFGGGLRRCIGMELALYEMKMMLGTLLARVSLARADSRPLRPSWRFFSLAPSNGLPIRLTERSTGHSANEVAADELDLKGVALASGGIVDKLNEIPSPQLPDSSVEHIS